MLPLYTFIAGIPILSLSKVKVTTGHEDAEGSTGVALLFL